MRKSSLTGRFAIQFCEKVGITRSPTLKRVTDLPTATTSPAPSENGTIGSAPVAPKTGADWIDPVVYYRVGTQLRMVRITPGRGPAYYLYDRDGDGALDRDDADKLPQTYWKLFSW